MKKPVPDPPKHPSAFPSYPPPHHHTTTHTPFSSCQGRHPPLFAVCAGIELECALMHLSRVLEAALDSNLQACNLADKRVESLTWATQLSLEMGQAVVESLLAGRTLR